MSHKKAELREKKHALASKMHKHSKEYQMGAKCALCGEKKQDKKFKDKVESMEEKAQD